MSPGCIVLICCFSPWICPIFNRAYCGRCSTSERCLDSSYISLKRISGRSTLTGHRTQSWRPVQLVLTDQRRIPRDVSIPSNVTGGGTLTDFCIKQHPDSTWVKIPKLAQIVHDRVNNHPEVALLVMLRYASVPAHLLLQYRTDRGDLIFCE